MDNRKAETIHFSSNGHTGINFSAQEKENGDLLLLRCFQSATPQHPEMFTVRSEERHGLMEYLNKSFTER